MTDFSISRRYLFGGALLSALASCAPPDESSPGGGSENGRVSNDTWALTYRIRVSAFAKGQRREGSSILRTIYKATPAASLDQVGRFRTQTWGEAIPIDMGEGDHLFALLGNVPSVSSEHHLIVTHPRALISTLPRGETTAEAFRSGELYERIAQSRGEHPLHPQLLPLMVHFSKSTDPISAAFVPWPDTDDAGVAGTPVRTLEEAFGRGARVDRATFEIVSEPLTEQIESLLPWVARMPGANGGTISTGGEDVPFGRRLRFFNFKLEGFRA